MQCKVLENLPRQMELLSKVKEDAKRTGIFQMVLSIQSLISVAHDNFMVKQILNSVYLIHKEQISFLHQNFFQFNAYTRRAQ